MSQDRIPVTGLRRTKGLLRASVALSLGLLAATPALAQDLQQENRDLRRQIEDLRRQLAGGKASVEAGAPQAEPHGEAPARFVPSPDGADIVVSSRNRRERAQDVPLPVAVLGGETLEREDIKSIWDLPSKVPNLQLNNPGENARKVSPSIRGLGRGGANDSMEQSVAVIVDGVTLY